MPGSSPSPAVGRRGFIVGAGLAAAVGGTPRAFAQGIVDLGLPGGRSVRPMADAFADKRGMILQRNRPPLLETPMAVFDKNVFTPNDRFFVRWHWADFPTRIDADAFALKVRGHVARPLSLSLARILALPRVEIAAVNQCSGNSRGFFVPRVPGAQWGHGAMGNARWMGVSLKSVLDLAGVKAGAVAVRFNGLDRPTAENGPDFSKSLAIDHARDGEVMLAFAMNGEPLPLMNGFPLRLVVPGWYSTYWIKMLDDIEVLTAPDDNFWMATAYRIPTTPFADVAPGAAGFPTEPIGRMVPRAWITNLAEGATLAFAPRIAVGGIAMGGDAGVAKVELSTDGGAHWTAATLGADEGRYSFRRFDATIAVPAPGPLAIMARCANADGATQPLAANWNPSGYMRANVETTRAVIA